MPRSKKKAKTRRSWGPVYRFWLKCGVPIGDCDWGGEPYDDETLADIRAAWETLGPAIMESWIKERPATRPHGWWLLNSPEPKAEHWDDRAGCRVGETEFDQLQRLGQLTDQEISLYDRGQ